MYRRFVLRLYRKTLESEFSAALGFPVLFSRDAPMIWLAIIGFILIIGFFGWLEGAML